MSRRKGKGVKGHREWIAVDTLYVLLNMGAEVEFDLV